MQVPTQSPKVETVPLTQATADQFAQKNLWERIKKIALPILKYVAATACFCIHPPLFVVGAVIGAVVPQAFDNSLLERIKSVWKHNDWATLTFAGVIALSTVPIALACSALIVGAHCSAVIVSESMRRAEEEQQMTNSFFNNDISQAQAI